MMVQKNKLRVPPVPRFWGPGRGSERASIPGVSILSRGLSTPIQSPPSLAPRSGSAGNWTTANPQAFPLTLVSQGCDGCNAAFYKLILPGHVAIVVVRLPERLLPASDRNRKLQRLNCPGQQ